MTTKNDLYLRCGAILAALAFMSSPADISAATPSSSSSSTYAEALRKMASTNRSLAALETATDAAKAENLSGLTLSNPQVDFAYQWGSPAETPDKIVLDVSQSFDFATLSGAKKAAARSLNRVAEAEFSIERLKTVAEIDLLMTRAVYLSKLDSLYSAMMDNSSKLVEVLTRANDEGAATSMELNDARMAMAVLRGEQEVNAYDLIETLEQLRSMAGGELTWRPAGYMPYTMPLDLASYTEEVAGRDPEVVKAREEVLAAGEQVRLRSREGLPEFSLGYTSEMVKDANYYGVSVGVALPLWGNRGRVKAARAAQAAAEAAVDASRFSSMSRLRLGYGKALALGKVADKCRDIRRECDNSADIELLYKEGKITFQEYLVRMAAFFDLDRRVLDADYAWQQALAEFRAAGAAY